MKEVVIIGSGFGALSASCFLAKAGFKVTILEKNSQPGGRARTLDYEGFRFDMGPSWYWMPEVFERFFQQFGYSVADFYDLKRLDPSYRVFFGENDLFDVPAEAERLGQLFENLEPGAGKRLTAFLSEAERKYRHGMGDFVFKPSLSVMEFASITTLKGAMELDLLSTFKKHVLKYFRHPKILKIMEFPVLFLGASPEKTPALYSLMNYADLKLGTWYPMGGMNQIVVAMTKLAKSLGVEFSLNSNVISIQVDKPGKATFVHTEVNSYRADVVLANADYAHVDASLLSKEWRSYSPSYWDSRKMAPSSLLYYVGLGRRVENLKHHNLFFDEEFSDHAKEIYDQPAWPSKPLFYLSAPSVTDTGIAPEGKENLFFLIPTSPGMIEDDGVSARYFDYVTAKTEKLTGNRIKADAVFSIPFGPRNFVQDYNAHKANAYGLANTLLQTAFLKPSIHSKKVDNLYFTGQLTVPGPGVPPALISGEVVANEISKRFLS